MAEKQKHVVNVTISDPNHTMVSKRKEKISRRATVSADSKESAVQGALRFYRKQGLRVHDHDYVGLKEEVEQMDEANRDVDYRKMKEETELDEVLMHDRYLRSHGKKARGTGSWAFTTKQYGEPKEHEMVFTSGQKTLGDAHKEASKKLGTKHLYVMEEVEQMDEAAMTKKRAAADIMFKRHADKVAEHEKAASAAYDKGDTKLGDKHTAKAQKHDSIAQKHYNTLHKMGRAPSRMDQSWHPTNEAIKPKSKEDEGEYGYEGDMAMSQLRSIIRNSQAMLDNLDEKTDLPEWVQSKLTLAKDYIETSANYLMSELEEERRTNDVARKFIGARQERERQRKRLGEPKLYEGVSAKAERTAKRIIDKKRKSLVNLKPQTNSMPMHGNMMTQAPTSDASAPTPGENR